MDSPTDTQVTEKVIGIISEVLKIESVLIKPESRIVEELGADSLDKVSLLMMLEDQFGKQISDDDAKVLLTVGDTVGLVKKLMAERDA